MTLQVTPLQLRDLKWPLNPGVRGGGTGGTRPLYFFAEIRRLTLCGHPRQKECTKSCELTLKITIFLASEGRAVIEL